MVRRAHGGGDVILGAILGGGLLCVLVDARPDGLVVLVALLAALGVERVTGGV